MTSTKAPRDRLISDRQAADLLGVSPTSVKRMRRDRTLTTVPVRGRALIRESEVLAYIADGGEVR
jgi:excisionase family DNA binding protein